MKYLLVLVSLFLFSCSTLIEDNIPCAGEPIPGYSNAGQESDGAGYRVDDVSAAFDIFSNFWTEKYPEDIEVFASLHHLCIEWKAEAWTSPYYTNEEGEPTLYIAGQTFNPRDIHVWVGKPDEEIGFSLGRTSLFHEIVHTILWRQGFFYGDPDHQQDSYKGWTDAHNELIVEMKKRAIEEGI